MKIITVKLVNLVTQLKNLTEILRSVTAWCSFFHKSGLIRLMMPEAEQTKHTNTSHQHALIKKLVSIRKILENGNLSTLY